VTDRADAPRRRSLLLAGAAGLLGGIVPPPAAAATTRIAWPELRLLDGSTLAPSAWDGIAAVVVFWSTTCPFCKRHNVHVEKLFRSVADRPLRVLGVALDRDPAAVRRYVAGNGYGFAVTLDEGRLQQRFSSRRVIPMSCVVDRHGMLVKVLPGEMFEEDVMELPALAGAAAI
jgi:thiol-disulfide isomerase/thioredoxin